MDRIFDIDSPLMRFLTLVFDLVILNLIFMLTSLPVITIGASITAMSKACQALVNGTNQRVLASYFRAFAGNFKKATLAWLIILLLGAAAVCNLLFVAPVMGQFGGIYKAILYVVLGLLLAISVYVFPLIARYENSVKQYFINAAILAVTNFSKTVLLIIFALASPCILLLFQNIFVQYWMLFGFSLMCYLANKQMKAVFEKIEKKQNSGENCQNEELEASL